MGTHHYGFKKYVSFFLVLIIVTMPQFFLETDVILCIYISLRWSDHSTKVTTCFMFSSEASRAGGIRNLLQLFFLRMLMIHVCSVLQLVDTPYYNL